MQTNVYFWHIAEFFLEWDMLQTNVVGKTKHTFYGQYIFFFFETRGVYVT